MKIAVLGPKYSYSHILGMRNFPEDEFKLCISITKVFDDISDGDADLGIVPIENMLQGTVRESILALLKYKVKIRKGFNFHIRHCLAGNSECRKIISHPQALGQCSGFVSGKETIGCASTAKAMQIAAEDPEFTAIGSKEAAKNYGLQVLEENISDNKDNMTRFLLISKEENDEGANTSLLLNPKEDKPGLLFQILSPFAAQGINLSKIESLPSGKKIGEYVFYIEVSGSLNDQKVRSAIEFLKNILEVYSFGSYDVQEI